MPTAVGEAQQIGEVLVQVGLVEEEGKMTEAAAVLGEVAATAMAEGMVVAEGGKTGAGTVAATTEEEEAMVTGETETAVFTALGVAVVEGAGVIVKVEGEGTDTEEEEAATATGVTEEVETEALRGRVQGSMVGAGTEGEEEIAREKGAAVETEGEVETTMGGAEPGGLVRLIATVLLCVSYFTWSKYCNYYLFGVDLPPLRG